LLITEELLTPEIIIDAEISFSEITPSFYSILLQMEPFGPENMRPFLLQKMYMMPAFQKL
jgi:single-stranded-DNA-specific exonuclease